MENRAQMIHPADRDSPIRSVAKNSIWIGVLPSILTVISIFVMGSIADRLGPENYGRFIFAFSSVMLVSFICSFGLRTVMVRDIASDHDKASEIIGKLISLRLFLACIGYLLLVLIIFLIDYPQETKKTVAIAGMILIFLALATTYLDVFQAFEKTKYMAYALFISGVCVTAFSVIVVILLGYGLTALILTYVLGPGVLYAVSVFFYRNQAMPHFKAEVNLTYWWVSLKRGWPFLLGGSLSHFDIQVGILLLSKMMTETTVGRYGAAAGLTDRLVVIPDAICTAIFPTLSFLYSKKNEQVMPLFENFFQFIVLIGLPIAIGTTLLSEEIILFIYGEKYLPSAATLTILSWTIPMAFLTAFQRCALQAVNLQKQVVVALTLGTAVNVGLTLYLIPRFHENGVAMARLAASTITAIATFYFIFKALSFLPKLSFLLKASAANLIMGTTVILLKEYHLLFSIFLPAGVYVIALFFLGVITRDDLNLLKNTLRKRKTSPSPTA